MSLCALLQGGMRLCKKYNLHSSCLSVCEAGGSGREELNRFPPPSPAVLWIMNVHETKPRQKKNEKCDISEKSRDSMIVW